MIKIENVVKTGRVFEPALILSQITGFPVEQMMNSIMIQNVQSGRWAIMPSETIDHYFTEDNWYPVLTWGKEISNVICIDDAIVTHIGQNKFGSYLIVADNIEKGVSYVYDGLLNVAKHKFDPWFIHAGDILGMTDIRTSKHYICCFNISGRKPSIRLTNEELGEIFDRIKPEHMPYSRVTMGIMFSDLIDKIDDDLKSKFNK